MLSLQLICMPPLLLSIVAIIAPKRLDVSLFSKLYLSKLKTVVEQVRVAAAAMAPNSSDWSRAAALRMTLLLRCRMRRTTRACGRAGRTAGCSRTSTPAASPPKRCRPSCTRWLPASQTPTARTRCPLASPLLLLPPPPTACAQVPCEESPLHDLSSDLYRSNHVVYLESLISPESGAFAAPPAAAPCCARALDLSAVTRTISDLSATLVR